MENMMHDHDLRLDTADCDNIDVDGFKNQTSNDVSMTKGTESLLSLNGNWDIHPEKDGLSTDRLSMTKCTDGTGNALDWDWGRDLDQDGLPNFLSGNCSNEGPSALIHATTEDSKVNKPNLVDFWDQGADVVDLILSMSSIDGDSSAVVRDEGIVKNPSNQESSVAASVKNSIISVDSPDRETIKVATKNSSNEEFFAGDCKHKSSKSSLPLVEEDRSSLENHKLTIDGNKLTIDSNDVSTTKGTGNLLSLNGEIHLEKDGLNTDHLSTTKCTAFTGNIDIMNWSNAVHDHDARLYSTGCDIDMVGFKNQTSNDESMTKGIGNLLSLNGEMYSEKDGLSIDHLNTTKCTARTGNIDRNFLNWSNAVLNDDPRLYSSGCDIDMGGFKNQTSNDVSTMGTGSSLSLNGEMHLEKDGLSTDHLSMMKCTSGTGNIGINFLNWNNAVLDHDTRLYSSGCDIDMGGFMNQTSNDVSTMKGTGSLLSLNGEIHLEKDGLSTDHLNMTKCTAGTGNIDNNFLNWSNEGPSALIHDEGIVKNHQESSVVASSVKNSITSVDSLDRETVKVATKNSKNEEFFAGGCKHKSSKSSLPLVEEDRSSLENNKLTIDDVTPIDAARERLLDIILEHFIKPTRVTQSSDYEADRMVRQSSQDEVLIKRKSGELQYDDDCLPMMYIVNMYETFVNEGDKRLSSINGMQGETIGVALDGAGGLYRKFTEKFPKEGTFKRRELAASGTRLRFPELVLQEKRVRIPVVNALTIIEKPTRIGFDDAEWFKRLTGRHEVAVCERDYKFYSQRNKRRQVLTNFPSLPTPTKKHMQPTGLQLHKGHPNPQATHNQQPQLPDEICQIEESLAAASSQPLGHVGHVVEASPAIFCDQCGSRYLMENSKFCPCCGAKRLEI